MTRKDFQAVTDIIRSFSKGAINYDLEGRHVLERITEEMADLFQKDNPRFDKEKFYEACGYYAY